MTLDPRIPDLIDTPHIRAIKEKPFSVQRELFKELSLAYQATQPKPKTVKTSDFKICDCKVRRYIPEASNGTFYAIHGGGWSVGSIETYDLFWRHLAEVCQMQVFAIDYRLSPEYKFPIPVEDTLNIYQELISRKEEFSISMESLYVIGDSAGGNLATVLCHEVEAHQKPAGQILIYPSCDTSKSYPSHDKYSEYKYNLDRAWTIRFIQSYQRKPTDVFNPKFSPMLYKSHKGLPKAMVVLVDHDPLYDEGLAYAQALKKDDVQVELCNYPTMFHGFMNLIGTFNECHDLLGKIRDFVQS